MLTGHFNRNTYVPAYSCNYPNSYMAATQCKTWCRCRSGALVHVHIKHPNSENIFSLTLTMAGLLMPDSLVRVFWKLLISLDLMGQKAKKNLVNISSVSRNAFSDERSQRRMAFNNTSTLYNGTKQQENIKLWGRRTTTIKGIVCHSCQQRTGTLTLFFSIFNCPFFISLNPNFAWHFDHPPLNSLINKVYVPNKLMLTGCF